MFIDPFDFWIEGRVYDELQVAAAQEKTAGGLLLTETCKEKPSIGTVIILSFGHISFQNHITETSYIFCLNFPIKEYLVLTGYVVITLGHDTVEVSPQSCIPHKTENLFKTLHSSQIE